LITRTALARSRPVLVVAGVLRAVAAPGSLAVVRALAAPLVAAP